MREEANGRNYYDYNQGARYVIHSHRTEEKELLTIEIGGMQVTKGGEELYLILSQRNEARDILGEWTKMQLELYLAMSTAMLAEEGTPIEYPLTFSEVKWFYSAQKKKRNAALLEANKTLIGELKKDNKGVPKKDKNGKLEYEGGIEEYRYLLKEKEILENILAERYSKNKYSANQESMYRKNCERMIELIRQNNIPLSLFRAEKVCLACKNRGIDAKGRICECAKAKEEEIKAFCAGERLKKKLAESWVDSFAPEDSEDDHDEADD